ncbi:MAG: c-type cytochrome [Candidatus Promineifilaceae bacterium]|nr:c-type cytochrome [Candidatus Promineifilaceae bacterium]
MNRKVLFTLLGLVMVLLLAACGGGGDAPAASEGGNSIGDAANGENLYNQTVIGSASAPGCITCHSLEPDIVLVGPSHAGLANRAGSYKEGMAAEDYLRESIVDPDAHIVEGFTPGVMYQNFGEELQAREVNDLIAYMLTLN